MVRNVSFRLIFIGGIVASAAFAWSQSLDQKVDISSIAVTAKNLLAELSKQTAMSFKASTLTSNDVLIVEAKGVRLSALMDRIAEAVSGEWKRDGETYVLNRDLSLSKKEDREYLDFRAARIKEDIDNGLQELAKQGAFDGAKVLNANSPGRATFQTNDNGQAQTIRIPNGNEAPIGRALSRVLGGFNALELAAISQGTRVVFATNPTRMQRTLPGQAVRALDTFMQEQEAYVHAASPAESQSGNFMFLGGESRPLAFQGGFGKAILVLYRAPWQDDIRVDLKIADSTGQIRASYSKTLGPSGFGLAANRSAENTADQASKEPVHISENAKQIAELMKGQSLSGGGDNFIIRSSGGSSSFSITSTSPGGGGGGEPEKKLSPEIRALIENPDANEPLGFAVTEMIRALIKPDANLVALLPDSLLAPISMRATQPITLPELHKLLFEQLDMKMSEREGWTMVVPKYPTLSRSNRVDRAGLTVLLNNIRKETRLSLNAISSYASGHMQPSATGIESMYVSALYPQAKPTFGNSISNWKMLQFYAALDPVRRATLRDQGMISLGGLSMQQMGIVNNMVFNDPNGPNRRDPNRDGSPQPSAAPQVSTRTVIATAPSAGRFGPGGPGMMEYTANLMDERTEFLRDGIPSSGTLLYSGETTEAVYATQNEMAMQGRYFNASEFGAYQGMMEGPVGANLPQYVSFRPATVTRMTFTFELTPEARLVRQLDENAVDMASRPVGFQLLSDSFRKAAEEARARMANANSKMQFQFGPGGGNPPPPQLL